MKRRLLLLAATMLLPAAPALAADPPAPAKPPEKTVEAVTVNGAQQSYRSAIDRKSYSLKGDLQTATGAVSDALRNVPGLDVDVQGNVTLRGQPVTIMVDGKPSALFNGPSAAQALQAMGADQYERVEVIPNPPAEFRPDGAGGVINLISNKNRKPGYSASVKANYAPDARYNGSVTGGYNSKDLTLSGTASYRRDPQKFFMARHREVVGGADAGSVIDETNLTRGTGRIINTSGSADYDLNSRDRLSAQLSYFDMRIRGGIDDRFVDVGADGDPDFAFDLIGPFGLDVDVWNGQAGWKRKFGDDHELSVNLSQERVLARQLSPDVLSVHTPAAPDLYEDNRFRSTTDETDLKVDYTRPLPNEVKLKAGYELIVTQDRYDNFGATGPSLAGEVIDPARTNRFAYDQAINAAYVSYERPFGDLTVQAGLRLERADIDINQVTSAIKASNDYTRAYPTLHLSYKLDDGQTLTGSYSRRVQRPDPDDLNPYRTYAGASDYRQGDPYLKPQMTDSFEVGYEKQHEGTDYQATLYWRVSHNVFSDLVEDLGDGVLLTTRANIGVSRTAGVQLVASGKLSKTLSYNLSADGYWNEIDAGNLGVDGRRSAYTLAGRATLNWQATRDDFVQLQGNLSGKRLRAQGYREPWGMLNIGYRHKFNDKVSGVVTVRDLLGTSDNTYVVDTPAFHDRQTLHPNFRAVFVGVTYAFGGAGKKPKDQGFDFGGGAAPGGPS